MPGSPPRVQLCWTALDWARAIVALPVEAPLPLRTVLVPRERVAHALRRELGRAGHPEALAGTRFLTPPAAAAGVLQAAGHVFTAGEESLRPARLLTLFRGHLALEHFSLRLLRSKPGWDDAFARTLGDLEDAGLRPADLEDSSADARVRDVARIWRAADASADRTWSTGRIVLEAALALEEQARRWPFDGPALACITGGLTGAEARLLRAIPGITLALLAARPVRAHHADRVKALLGREAARAIATASAPAAGATEREILASYLFEPPAVLSDPGRARSRGPDGTVDLEEHAGVDAEIEAAVDWVARQALSRIALQDIAVLLPALDPLAALVAARLERLPWNDGEFPVHVAGGLPLTARAGGARALAVVRALRAHLSGEALADVLPALRTTDVEARHLARGAAMDLVWSLGTAGGNPAHPRGALQWASRAAARESALAAELERARAASGDPEQAGLARAARDLERLLGDLRAMRRAIDALVGVAALVVDQASLAALWPALRTFLAEWLLEPGDGARAHALVDEQLRGAAGDGACGALRGEDALRAIESAILSTRVPVGRFGDPAVYVGTVAGAVGLRFDAVRVIGLAEGYLPPLPREDPVIPDVVRARLTAPVAGGRAATLVTGRHHALAALHALDAVIRDAQAAVALSAPAIDLERSQREGSSVLLEAAAALGRPNTITGEASPTIPDTSAMRRDAFLPSRRRALDFRRALPLGETAWLDGVADGSLSVPGGWLRAGALDLERIGLLARPDAPIGPPDGLLGAGATDVAVPGLTPEWSISPSDLKVLLQCPHRYLLSRLLGFDEPAGAPARREIGQPAYGGLFHRAVETFYREHGRAFCAGERSLEAWRARADEIVEREFDLFLEQYPLVGEAVRRHERERLRGDLHDLLADDWDRGPARHFVAVERPFGYPDPVQLTLGRPSLHLRGKIDRIDRTADRTLIRDFKTGRAHPRSGDEAEPDPVLDVQLAVYALIASRLATAWGIPATIGAAYSYFGRGPGERDWRADFHETLEPAAREWLALAADLLQGRAFPRTPAGGDCRYCAFRPICGEDRCARAAHVLAGTTGALARFAAMKGLPTLQEPR
jgi:RecB family exonuclease